MQENIKIIKHDGEIYFPRGGGSYVFGENFNEYILKNLKKEEIRISVGAQPNSSPHFGTLVVFSLAFALAKKLKELKKDLKIKVFFEIVDTAPSEEKIVKGINYQISLRKTDKYSKTIEQYYEILNYLKDLSNIEYEHRSQKDFNKSEITKVIVNDIINNQDIIASILDPKKSRLRIRTACPHCNLSDKDAEKTIFNKGEIISFCPKHGEYKVNILDSVEKLEYNTPLRNLIRGLLYSKENQDKKIPYEWIRLTGSDYAGFYQEQLLYKSASILNTSAENLPLLIYAPLITDWSGAKLSKSLYVKENAYSYLPEYVINFKELKNKFGLEGLKKIYLETVSWINKPYKLFRNYSVYYFINLLEKE